MIIGKVKIICRSMWTFGENNRFFNDTADLWNIFLCDKCLLEGAIEGLSKQRNQHMNMLVGSFLLALVMAIVTGMAADDTSVLVLLGGAMFLISLAGIIVFSISLVTTHRNLRLVENGSTETKLNKSIKSAAFEAEGERILKDREANADNEGLSAFTLPEPLNYLPMRNVDAIEAKREKHTWSFQVIDEETGVIDWQIKRILEKVEKYDLKILQIDDIRIIMDNIFPVCGIEEEKTLLNLLLSYIKGLNSSLGYNIAVANEAILALCMSGTKDIVPFLIEILDENFKGGDENTKINVEVALERITGKGIGQKRFGYSSDATEWRKWASKQGDINVPF